MMSKVISMTGYLPSGAAKVNGVRDRRYTIRYPFAADAEIIDIESGKQISGVTSDISLGGCFICTSQTFRVNSRARLRLSRKGEILEALVVVFLDLEEPSADVLGEWISTLRARR
jgi:PilZ domain